MRGTRVKRLRTNMRPHPGRKGGGHFKPRARRRPGVLVGTPSERRYSDEQLAAMKTAELRKTASQHGLPGAWSTKVAELRSFLSTVTVGADS